MTWLRCGRFGRPHGLRGEVRLWPDNPATPLLCRGRAIQVGPESGPEARYEIEGVRRDAQGPLVRLAGVADRDAAAALTDRFWFEPREAFEPAGEDEYYVADLVGLRARTEDGRALGEVRDVWNFGGGDILVIRDERHEHLVPFAGTHVVRVEGGEVVVRVDDDDEEPPPGNGRRG
jgi:16S rRNA processing protein RimM